MTNETMKSLGNSMLAAEIYRMQPKKVNKDGTFSTILGKFTIHDVKVCEAPCPFHAPSNHPLNDAPMQIREDKKFLVERVCEHGVGHDDPDSVAYLHKQGETWAGTHGCDGCCSGGLG